MNLRALRQIRGLTQKELAELIGVDQSTIQRAEAMHPSAKLATYLACAEALETTLSEIFSEDSDTLAAALIHRIRSLDDEAQRRAIAILDIAESRTPTDPQ